MGKSAQLPGQIQRGHRHRLRGDARPRDRPGRRPRQTWRPAGTVGRPVRARAVTPRRPARSCSPPRRNRPMAVAEQAPRRRSGPADAHGACTWPGCVLRPGCLRLHSHLPALPPVLRPAPQARWNRRSRASGCRRRTRALRRRRWPPPRPLLRPDEQSVRVDGVPTAGRIVTSPCRRGSVPGPLHVAVVPPARLPARSREPFPVERPTLRPSALQGAGPVWGAARPRPMFTRPSSGGPSVGSGSRISPRGRSIRRIMRSGIGACQCRGGDDGGISCSNMDHRRSISSSMFCSTSSRAYATPLQKPTYRPNLNAVAASSSVASFCSCTQYAIAASTQRPRAVGGTRSSSHPRTKFDSRNEYGLVWNFGSFLSRRVLLLCPQRPSGLPLRILKAAPPGARQRHASGCSSDSVARPVPSSATGTPTSHGVRPFSARIAPSNACTNVAADSADGCPRRALQPGIRSPTGPCCRTAFPQGEILVSDPRTTAVGRGVAHPLVLLTVCHVRVRAGEHTKRLQYGDVNTGVTPGSQHDCPPTRPSGRPTNRGHGGRQYLIGGSPSVNTCVPAGRG